MQELTATRSTQPLRQPASFLARSLLIHDRHPLGLIACLLLALMAGFLAYISRMHAIDHDLFHEMALFREWLVRGSFPTTDLFAYTPTVQSVVHHEWGTGAILYFATIGTGLGALGLGLLRLLLVASLWLFLYRIARLRGASPILFAITSLCVFPFIWVGFATIRAQLFTLVFIAAQLWMQELDCRGRRAWILVWLVMLVAWLNMHAGFVVGAGMIAVHTVERFFHHFTRDGFRSAMVAIWHLALAGPVAVGLLWVNPYGSDYITYLLHAITMPRPLVIEWQPLWKNYAPGLTILGFLLAMLMFAYCLRNLRSLSQMRGAITLAICAYMALKHIRHGSIFAVVWIAYVPAWLSRTDLGMHLVKLVHQHQRFAIRSSGAMLLACLTFAVYHQAWQPSLPSTPTYSSSCYPTEAVAYLKEHGFRGNVLTTFQTGAYVSWHLYPHVKISLDSRYEVAFRDDLVHEHVDFFKRRGEHWNRILKKYPTDLAMIPTNCPAFQELSSLTGSYWQVVYRDDAYVVLANQHWSEQLPLVDNRNRRLEDRVDEVFGFQYSHWSRQTHNLP